MFKALTFLATLLLFAAICTPAVHADTITDGTLTFTVVNSPGPTPTGSFVFDNTTSVFTGYTIDWDGVVYDFTSAANIAGFATATYQPSAYCASAPAAAFTCPPALPGAFSLFFFSLQPSSGTFSDPTAFAGGIYTITETVTTTPEPSSVALMLAGIGFLLAIRKRLTRAPWLAN
jgi:PEP-CTERM motif-containing protein